MTKRVAEENDEAVKKEIDRVVSHELLPGSVSWDPSYKSHKGPPPESDLYRKIRAAGVPRHDDPRRAGEYSTEELVLIAAEVRRAADDIYWLLFHRGMGGLCHPFLEFAGLMSKYGDIVTRAAEAGVQFPHASDHNKMALPMESYDAEYLAEKLRCIFGPALDHNPEVRAAFKRALFGE